MIEGAGYTPIISADFHSPRPNQDTPARHAVRGSMGFGPDACGIIQTKHVRTLSHLRPKQQKLEVKTHSRMQNEDPM